MLSHIELAKLGISLLSCEGDKSLFLAIICKITVGYCSMYHEGEV